MAELANLIANGDAIILMNPWSKPLELTLSTYTNLYAAKVGLNELTSTPELITIDRVDHVVARVLCPP